MDTDSTTTKSETYLLVGAITLTVFSCTLALLSWLQHNNWQVTGLSLYQVFPIFGLFAFSIMWSQYIMEAIKNYLGYTDAIGKYFRRTSFLVLLAILLHPGILIAQRYKDGYGLPPGSYETYVAPMQKWVVLLGSVSLLMFLAFELKRFFGTRSWWKYVVLLNDIAIVAIFYHGLRLGTNLQSDWYQIVWFAYGITLALALGYKYYRVLSVRRATTTV